jgi:VanZ family protein
MKRRYIIISFIFLIFWVGIILFFGTRNPEESSNQTNFVYNVIKSIDNVFDFSDTKWFREIEVFLKKLWLRDQYADSIALIRKSAHFGIYFILGLFSWLFGYLCSKKFLIGTLLGISLPALIAVIDEYSQEFVGRGPSLYDVLIDISGAVFANIIILVIYIFYIISKKIYLRREKV